MKFILDAIELLAGWVDPSTGNFVSAILLLVSAIGMVRRARLRKRARGARITATRTDAAARARRAVASPPPAGSELSSASDVEVLPACDDQSRPSQAPTDSLPSSGYR
jgi:hypothetical protein